MVGGSAAVMLDDTVPEPEPDVQSQTSRARRPEPEPCRSSSILRKQGKPNYLRKNVSWLDQNGFHCLVEVKEIPSNNMGKKCNDKNNKDTYVKIQHNGLHCLVEVREIPSNNKGEEAEESGGREYLAKSVETQGASGALGVNEAAVEGRSLRSSAGAPEEEEEESGGREYLAKSAKTQGASGALGVNGIRTGSHIKDDQGAGAVVAPEPVDSLDDAGDAAAGGHAIEKIVGFFVSKKCAGYITGKVIDYLMMFCNKNSNRRTRFTSLPSPD